jgi:hypothetical protein
MARKQIDRCPNCGVSEPVRGWNEGANRYRYCNLDRLYAGIRVARVVSYGLQHHHGWIEGIDRDDFDRAFGEWLDWSVDDDGVSESKPTSDNSWLSRPRTHFLKRTILECGCHVTFELARDPSAAHAKIDHTFDHCPAHTSLTGGYAFDMKGRCYICEWPITPYAKGYTNKLLKRDKTYQAIAIHD